MDVEVGSNKQDVCPINLVLTVRVPGNCFPPQLLGFLGLYYCEL